MVNLYLYYYVFLSHERRNDDLRGVAYRHTVIVYKFIPTSCYHTNRLYLYPRDNCSEVSGATQCSFREIRSHIINTATGYCATSTGWPFCCRHRPKWIRNGNTCRDVSKIFLLGKDTTGRGWKYPGTIKDIALKCLVKNKKVKLGQWWIDPDDLPSSCKNAKARRPPRTSFSTEIENEN